MKYKWCYIENVIGPSFEFHRLFHHLIKSYKYHISKAFCLIYTALREARFGKKIKINIGEAEQPTSFNKCIKNTCVNLFVCPFAFTEKGGFIVGCAHNVNFSLALFFRIILYLNMHVNIFPGMIEVKQKKSHNSCEVILLV